MTDIKISLTEELKQTWDDAFSEKPEIGTLEPGAVRNNTTHMLEMQLREGSLVLNTKEKLEEFYTQEQSLGEETRAGDMANWDPILMSIVRRTAPSLVAHDLMGVQPMSGPTGLIFSMKSFYGPRPDAVGADANEAMGLNEPNQAFTTGITNPDYTDAIGAKYKQIDSSGEDRQGNYTAGTVHKTTAELEQMGVRERNGALGSDDSGDNANIVLAAANVWPEMSFRIDKVSITSEARMLKAMYTDELTADLKAIHGLNARDELASIMSTELTAEMNRESVSVLLNQAVIGCQNTAVPGFFDLDIDADGRWSIEKFKGLLLQINREAHLIATNTRRGVGNVIVTSSNIVAALDMAGVIDKTITTGKMNIDAVGTTYAGMLNGRFKVFVDPYTSVDYVLVGYKGSVVYDAGVYYCPHVPLAMVQAKDSSAFQNVLGFKTRYGMAVNPFIGDGSGRMGVGTWGTNHYYRKFAVRNL